VRSVTSVTLNNLADFRRLESFSLHHWCTARFSPWRHQCRVPST